MIVSKEDGHTGSQSASRRGFVASNFSRNVSKVVYHGKGTNESVHLMGRMCAAWWGGKAGSESGVPVVKKAREPLHQIRGGNIRSFLMRRSPRGCQ